MNQKLVKPNPDVRKTNHNPLVFELAHYTLRETDVNPVVEKAEAEGKRIIRANLGDPTKFDIYPFPRLMHHVSEAQLDPRNWGYPQAVGIPELRTLLATGNVFFGTKGYSLPPHHVFIGAGISGVARGLLTTLIDRAKGHEVIIPKWSYIIYLAEAALSGAIVRNVDLTPEALVDLNKLKDTINPKTKAVFITTVGNPLGVAMPHETFGEIIKIINAKEREFNHAIYLIADTIYEDFRLGPPLDPMLLSIQNNRIGPTVELYSVSKMFAAPGLRLGWMRVYHNEGGFPTDVHDFCEGFSNCRQPSLGPAPTATQLGVFRTASEFENPASWKEITALKDTRRMDVRGRVAAIHRALADLDGVVLMDREYPKANFDNSFYLVPGIDQRLCPHEGRSQASRMAEFNNDHSDTVLATTPAEHFLAKAYRDEHKKTQDRFRVVALDPKPDGVVESVRSFVAHLKSKH